MPEERTPAEKVFDRLSSAPIRHPASARLFADWRLQAGDVVTVTSGNEAYQVPVYNMEMTWKGSPMVEVDATGSKERPPLPALARRSYGGSRAQAQMEDDLDGISSQLVQQNDKIGLVVTETSGGNVIRAASIMAAINDDESSVKLKADHIELVGSTIKISDVISIQNGLSVINASGVSATFMDAETLQLRSGGSGSALNTVNPNSVSDVQVVPNGSSGYKLQKKTWGSPNTWTDAGTFSSAATVAGTWGSGKFTVSATSGTISPSTVETTIYGVTTNGAVSKQTLAGMINVPVKVVADVPEGGDYDDGTTVKTQTLGVSVGSLLKTGSFTTNGTKSPGTGYIGFSSVTVNVPTYANQTTLTRRNASTDGSYHGYLYRLESDGKTYTRLGSSNSYWYTTSANLGSTKTVHYD